MQRPQLAELARGGVTLQLKGVATQGPSTASFEIPSAVRHQQTAAAKGGSNMPSG